MLAGDTKARQTVIKVNILVADESAHLYSALLA